MGDNRPAMSAARKTVLCIVLLAGLALLRITDTYRVLSHTYDEPAHIAAGMEWLELGRYTYETQHPPMRAVYAVGPWLMGVRTSGEGDMWDEGRRILYDTGNYKNILTAARVAALPFFLVTLAVVGIWAARIGGRVAAVVAVFTYSMLPLALAHAGLATTDTLVTATLTLAIFTWTLWLDSNDIKHALSFGVAAALAVLSKFTALPFLGLTMLVSGLIWIVGRAGPNRRIHVRQFGRGAVRAIPLGLFVLWAGYHFSFAPVAIASDRPYQALDRLVGAQGSLHNLAYRLAELPVPMPEFVRGLGQLSTHNGEGHLSFFMGQVAAHGRLAFFPVGILIKTPIAFLLLAGVGLAAIVRLGARGAAATTVVPALAPLLILICCLPSGINIGMRHVLPMFPLLAVVAGLGFSKLWRSSPGLPYLGPVLCVTLLSWLGISSLRAHPDYIAYFNECCAKHPERWLMDSDLDWGQDLDRLAAALRRHEVGEVYLAYFGSAIPERHGLPPVIRLKPYMHVHGWIAVSEYRLAVGTGPPFDQYRWLTAYEPAERIGRSIRLYRLP